MRPFLKSMYTLTCVSRGVSKFQFFLNIHRIAVAALIMAK